MSEETKNKAPDGPLLEGDPSLSHLRLEMPKLHDREQAVIDAERALHSCLMEWKKSHGYGLTFAEMVRVISYEMGMNISTAAKYAIRVERHGDHNEPGGLA